MFDLEQLIWPISPAEFESEYWERKPLIVSRDQRDYYEGLLSLADVDEILSSSWIHPPLIRVVRDGQPTPLNEIRARGLYGHFGILEGMYAQLRSGSTIILNSLHERWVPLKRLCQSLAAHFSAAFQVNVYLTPPHSRGLKPHYDTHDVFVLQTHGVKRWQLFDAPKPLPLPGQIYRSAITEQYEPYQEFDLHAGEMLYMPRGWKHVAATGDAVSLHLTVGVYPLTWAAVVLQAVESVIEQDVRFRESLPIGFAAKGHDTSLARARLSELIDVLREAIEPESLIQNAAKEALLGRQPSLNGYLLDLAAAPRIDQMTRLRRRPDVPWELSGADGRLSLSFHGKVVDLPDHIEPELRFILESEGFSASSLPGDLDSEGRLVLVRRLLEEGFLTLNYSK